MTEPPLVRLALAPASSPRSGSKQAIVLSHAQMRQDAREWHRTHPEFTFDISDKMGRAKSDAERALAEVFHAEALDIGFWCKKDIVQYVVASLHAKASMTRIPSFRNFLAQYTEADQDIIETFIQTQPVHYWTYVGQKAASGMEETK